MHVDEDHDRADGHGGRSDEDQQFGHRAYGSARR
jgi:hypothetical protein